MKKGARGMVLFVPVFLWLILPQAHGLPQGESVETGAATFKQPNASTLVITAANNTVINFNSFNIAPNETVSFVQPLSSSSVLSRVTGGLPSVIEGVLNANGILFLVNPAGINFTPTAQVHAGALVASTLDISTNNFVHGNYVFEHQAGSGYAQILNAGSLSADNIALIASAVNNTGVIQARAGTVNLASGDKTTVSFDARGLIQVEVNSQTSGNVFDANGVSLKDAVANSGTITAGEVYMTAATALDLFKNAVNQTGTVRASGITEENGVIQLIGDGDIQASGTLDSGAGKVAMETSGTITVSSSLSTIGDTTVTAGKDVHVDAALTTISGNLSLIADGDLDGAGSFLQSQGTTISTVHSGDISLQGSGASTLANINSSGNLTLQPGGAPVTFAQGSGSSVTTQGSLKINPGVTLVAANTVYDIGKDWNNCGGFISGTSSVTLTGTLDAQVLGANTFYDFSVIEPGKLVRFDAENTQTFTGTLTLRGAFGELLVLESVEPPQPWSIDPQGPTDIQFALVADAVNTRGTPLETLHSSSLGNNYNMIIDPYWTGKGQTDNWSEASNWDTGTVPTAADTVTFDGVTGSNPNKDSLVDTLFGGTVHDLILNGYSGTLSLARNLTIAGDLTVNSGALNASPYLVTVQNTITLGGAAGVSGTLSSANDTLINAGVTLTLGADATFIAGGAFTMDATSSIVGAGHNLTLSAVNNSTLGSLSSVNLLTLEDGNASANVTFTSPTSPTLTTFQVNTVKTDSNTTASSYDALLSRNLGSGSGPSTPMYLYSVSNAPGGIQYIPTSGLGLYYQLANNIDASETANWNSGAGFAPIGNPGTPFTGNFNGNGHTVANLTIFNSNGNIGLFSAATGGTISDLGLVNASVTGGGWTGALVGVNDATITNCYSAGGTVTGTGSAGDSTGGLVGQNFASISYAYSTAEVNGTTLVGGLVGYNTGTIGYSYAAGAVSGTPPHTGGIVGWNNGGSFTHCFFDMDISGQPDPGIPGVTGGHTLAMQTQSTFESNGWFFTDLGDGGHAGLWIMAGYPHLQIEYSTAITNVYQLQMMALNVGASYTLANSFDASETSRWNYDGVSLYNGFSPILGFTGSLNGEGYTLSNLTIDRPYNDYIGLFSQTTGSSLSNVGLVSVSVTGQNSVGALVGATNASTVITNCEADGSVTSLGPIGYVGGLVGSNSGSNIINSHASVNVSGDAGAYNAGGLAGFNSGTITNSYATGAVTVSGGSSVGGLVGYNDAGSISYSYATVTVNGTYAVGGLVGWNDMGSPSANPPAGAISYSYATGNVTGADYNTGGLVGYNEGFISYSHATGNVFGGNTLGGLVGNNGGDTTEYNPPVGSITNSYSTGNVSGNDTVGGLVGWNDLVPINYSYATGTVTGNSNVGSFVGRNSGTITASGLTVNAGETYSVSGGTSLIVENNLYIYGTLDAGSAIVTVSGDIVTTNPSGIITGVSPTLNVTGCIGTLADPMMVAVAGKLTLQAGGMQEDVSIAVEGEGNLDFKGALPGFVFVNGMLNDRIGQGQIRSLLTEGSSVLYAGVSSPTFFSMPLMMSGGGIAPEGVLPLNIPILKPYSEMIRVAGENGN